MGLRDILLETSYNSRKHNVIEDFYIPCFKNSVLYNRSTAYFTSTILRWVSRGMENFIDNGGRMQLVCSPHLGQEDIEAIKSGYCDREEIVLSAISREIDKMPENLTDDNLNLLSWLIKNNKLDIKIACVKNVLEEGLFHQKIGIFYDSDMDYVVFSGSNNETERAVAVNYEQFDVYRSWNDLEHRCKDKERNFDEIWAGSDENLKIYNFTDALKEKIIKKVLPQDKIFKSCTSESEEFSPGTSKVSKTSIDQFLKSIWTFQTKAIESFMANAGRGIFAMATGTGKTKTAVGALLTLFSREHKLFIVIVAPQNTILKQWEADIDSISIKYNKVCAYDNIDWKNQLADALIQYKMQTYNCCIVYTTYATFQRVEFINAIQRKVPMNAFLICDEVHSAGAETYQNGLLNEYKFRLGLSATPKRHYDEDGTDAITQFFSKEVFEFSLKEALEAVNPATGQTFLCPYYYHPIFISLTDAESNDYKELSSKIAKCHAASRSKSGGDKEYIDSLLLKRANILHNAANKLVELPLLLDKIDIEYLLIFTSDKQIGFIHDILNHRNVKHNRFTCEETPDERDAIIASFEKGDSRAIVSMKCLDEGVNILRAERAILMASSTNPKQYIQRRGRLLRRHPDKDMAYIYDMIVMPGCIMDSSDRAIWDKELSRYREFASLAINGTEAVNRLYDMYRKIGGI